MAAKASDFAGRWLTDSSTSMKGFFEKLTAAAKRLNDSWLTKFKKDKVPNAETGRLEEQISRCATLRSNVHERFQNADVLTFLMGRGAFEPKS